MKDVKDWYQQDEQEQKEKIIVPKKISGAPIGQSAWIIAGAIIFGSFIISTGIFCGN